MTKIKVTKIKPNNAGYRRLLNGIELQKYCNDLGEQVSKKAGTGYVVTTQIGKKRLHTRVAAVTKEAVRDNYENNTLLKAVS
jgi:hypothetical protein